MMLIPLVTTVIHWLSVHFEDSVSKICSEHLYNTPRILHFKNRAARFNTELQFCTQSEKKASTQNLKTPNWRQFRGQFSSNENHYGRVSIS